MDSFLNDIVRTAWMCSNCIWKREVRKKKLSNKHAIDLFMPFVATLSIYIVPIERSISFCLYNRLQLVRMHPIFVFSEMRKIFKQILWRCKCNLYVSGFECRRFNSINVCTNAYPIAAHRLRFVDADLLRKAINLCMARGQF